MKYRKLKNLTEIEKAYLAGLFDGEGSISLAKNKKTDRFRTPYFSISSTSYGIMRLCKEMTGLGFISQKKKYQDHHKQSYHWGIQAGTQVIDICTALLPYLREEIKWKRCKKLVSEWKSITKRNGKYTPEEIDRKYQFEKEFFSVE